MDEKAVEKIKEILNYAQIDGAHHKMWCLDQITRVVYGDKYDEFVKEYGEEYWDCGIAS